MDKKMLNTNYEFKLADGTTVNLTLNFFYLLQLKSKNKAMYERYCKILVNQGKGNYDEVESVELLYTAYCCANLDNSDLLSLEDFFLLCGSNRKALGDAVAALIAPKN